MTREELLGLTPNTNTNSLNNRDLLLSMPSNANPYESSDSAGLHEQLRNQDYGSKADYLAQKKQEKLNKFTASPYLDVDSYGKQGSEIANEYNPAELMYLQGRMQDELGFYQDQSNEGGWLTKDSSGSLTPVNVGSDDLGSMYVYPTMLGEEYSKSGRWLGSADPGVRYDKYNTPNVDTSEGPRMNLNFAPEVAKLNEALVKGNKYVQEDLATTQEGYRDFRDKFGAGFTEVSKGPTENIWGGDSRQYELGDKEKLWNDFKEKYGLAQALQDKQSLIDASKPASGADLRKSADELLKSREGFRGTSYKDSLGNLTAGYGHLLSEEEKRMYPEGTTIPQEQLDAWYKEDKKLAETAAQKQLKELNLPKEAFPVLVSMNFQLGTEWQDKFANTANDIKEGNYESATQRIAQSKWAEQTPVRAQDAINMLDTLTRGGMTTAGNEAEIGSDAWVQSVLGKNQQSEIDRIENLEGFDKFTYESQQLLSSLPAGFVKGAVELVDAVQEGATWVPQYLVRKLKDDPTYDIDLINDEYKEKFIEMSDDAFGYDRAADARTTQQIVDIIEKTGVDLTKLSSYDQLTPEAAAEIGILVAENPSAAATSLAEIFGSGGAFKAMGSLLFKGLAKVAPKFGKAVENLTTRNATKLRMGLKEELTLGDKVVDLVKGTSFVNADLAVRMNNDVTAYMENNDGNPPPAEDLLRILVTNKLAANMEMGALKIEGKLGAALPEAFKKGIVAGTAKLGYDLVKAGIIEGGQETVDGIVQNINQKLNTSKYEGMTAEDIISDATAEILAGTAIGAYAGTQVTAGGAILKGTVPALQGAKNVVDKGLDKVSEFSKSTSEDSGTDISGDTSTAQDLGEKEQEIVNSANAFIEEQRQNYERAIRERDNEPEYKLSTEDALEYLGDDFGGSMANKEAREMLLPKLKTLQIGLKLQGDEAKSKAFSTGLLKHDATKALVFGTNREAAEAMISDAVETKAYTSENTEAELKDVAKNVYNNLVEKGEQVTLDEVESMVFSANSIGKAKKELKDNKQVSTEVKKDLLKFSNDLQVARLQGNSEKENTALSNLGRLYENQKTKSDNLKTVEEQVWNRIVQEAQKQLDRVEGKEKLDKNDDNKNLENKLRSETFRKGLEDGEAYYVNWFATDVDVGTFKEVKGRKESPYGYLKISPTTVLDAKNEKGKRGVLYDVQRDVDTATELLGKVIGIDKEIPTVDKTTSSTVPKQTSTESVVSEEQPVTTSKYYAASEGGTQPVRVRFTNKETGKRSAGTLTFMLDERGDVSEAQLQIDGGGTFTRSPQAIERILDARNAEIVPSSKVDGPVAKQRAPKVQGREPEELVNAAEDMVSPEDMATRSKRTTKENARKKPSGRDVEPSGTAEEDMVSAEDMAVLDQNVKGGSIGGETNKNKGISGDVDGSQEYREASTIEGRHIRKRWLPKLQNIRKEAEEILRNWKDTQSDEDKVVDLENKLSNILRSTVSLKYGNKDLLNKLYEEELVNKSNPESTEQINIDNRDSFSLASLNSVDTIDRIIEVLEEYYKDVENIGSTQESFEFDKEPKSSAGDQSKEKEYKDGSTGQTSKEVPAEKSSAEIRREAVKAAKENAKKKKENLQEAVRNLPRIIKDIFEEAGRDERSPVYDLRTNYIDDTEFGDDRHAMSALSLTSKLIKDRVDALMRSVNHYGMVAKKTKSTTERKEAEKEKEKAKNTADRLLKVKKLALDGIIDKVIKECEGGK